MQRFGKNFADKENRVCRCMLVSLCLGKLKCAEESFICCTWSSSNLNITLRICYQGKPEKTGMLLHSWCFQMQGCVLLCDVSLLPVSFDLLQLFLIKQEQLPLR